MKKVAVLVLLSLVLVSVMQSVSLAVIDDGRSNESLEHTIKAVGKAAQGDKDGASEEACLAAAAGAATGAAIGSFVPVVGTAVGAGIGAFVGWLWGK